MSGKMPGSALKSNPTKPTRHQTGPRRKIAMQLLAVISLMVLLGISSAFQKPFTFLARRNSAGSQCSVLPLKPSDGRFAMPLSVSGNARKARGSSGSSIVMMAKKKMTPAQLAALAALEKFESQMAAATAPAAEAMPAAPPAPPAPSATDKKKKDKSKGNKNPGREDSEDAEENAGAIAGEGKGGPTADSQDKKNKRGKKNDFDLGDDSEYEASDDESVAEIPEVKASAPAKEEFSVESDDEFDFSNKGKKNKKDKGKDKQSSDLAQETNAKKKVKMQPDIRTQTNYQLLPRIVNEQHADFQHTHAFTSL
jgi:hypothetical protein